MAGSVILVTGVTQFLGSNLAGRLATAPGGTRVIGVDATLPSAEARSRMGAAEFARADIRNPLIGRVLEGAGVDTVVHAATSATPASGQARTMAKEVNVLGTMQLLAACQRSAAVHTLVVVSTTAVYGFSSRDPAICTETTEPRAVSNSGPARDALDIEGYVRSFARRRTDVRIAVPRLAPLIGPTVQTPLTKLFSMSPLVPTALGHDARQQFVHEDDAVEALRHLVLSDYAGTVNVAGAGVLLLSQAIHRAGRIPLPIPMAMLNRVAAGMRVLRFGSFSPDQVRLLVADRVVDTTRLSRDAGFTPRYSTCAAFDDFAATLSPALSADAVRNVEKRLARSLGVQPLPAVPSETEPASVRPRLVGIQGELSEIRPLSGRRRRS